MKPFTPSTHLFFFLNHIHNLFHDFRDWLCCTCCEVMYNIWKEFSPAAIYCFRLDGFHSISYSNSGISNGVILAELLDVLSGFSSRSRTMPSVWSRVWWAFRVLTIPWSRAWIRDHVFGDHRPLWHLQCWTHGVLQPGHCPLSKEL